MSRLPMDSEQIAGTVIRPGGGGYDAARASFNGTVDRRPAVIVQVASVDDVVTTVIPPAAMAGTEPTAAES